MKVFLRALLLPAMLLPACADDTVLQPDGPSHSSMATVTINGRLESADGNGICASATEFVEDVYVKVYAPGAGGTWTEVGATNTSCYLDTEFSVDVPSGTGYVIGGEFYAGKYDPYPQRWVDFRTFDALGSVTRDPILPVARTLNGRATLAGAPLQTAQLLLTTADATPSAWPYNIPGHFTSSAAGTWETFVGGPANMQRAARVTATCSDLLGTRLRTAPQTFTFPGGRSSFDCRYEVSNYQRQTHSGTRFVVTMFPGMIGTNQDVTTGGLGWGAQLVPTVGDTPERVTYRSRARDVRFVFSVNGSLVTTGGSGMLQLDPDSELELASGPGIALNGASRRITYELVDAVSGLRVRQQSFDGTGGDFILLNLRLTNESAGVMTLHGGIAADWGINGGGSMDGRVSMGGRLAYTRDHYVERYVGTVLLGTNYTPRTYFDTWGSREVEDGIDVVEGLLTQESADATSFLSFHTAGGFTLGVGRRRAMWFAIVAGNSLAELEANAAAAAADFTARTGLPSGM